MLKYQEDELRNFLEEVTHAGKTKDKNSLSPHALALLLKEQDALTEESSSGDDTRDLIQRSRNKKFLPRRHQSSGDQQSAAACTSTGGSLGSLHDLSETKQPKKVAGPNQGVASRCREGGSCGNLSRGSFETQPPRKKKGRRCRDAARASASQREGGSLQNLSKTEAASNESKKLHKSGSLSQVCSEVASGARSKNRRQKTASESSSSKYPRRLEDREGVDDSSEDEDNCGHPKLQVPPGAEGVFPPEGVGGASGGHCPDSSHADDYMSDVASEGESTDEEIDARPFSGRKCSGVTIEETGIELQPVKCHRSESEEVDKGINFSLSRPQGDAMLGSGHRTLLLQNSQSVTSVFKDEKSSSKCTEEENTGKRKLLGNKSDMGSCENKAALDENGNPVMSTSGGSGNPAVLAGDRPSTVMQTTSRKNVINTSLKDASRFDRVKARNDKKKANREKDIVNISETPGFCGDQDLNDILKFLGADVDNTNVKNRKKHKGKKDDGKDDKDGNMKKKCKSYDKTSEESVEKVNKSEDGKCKFDEENNTPLSDLAKENVKKNKEKEEEKKSNRKSKNDSKKNKKSSGTLRESSSMEDLVSKSKQSDNVRDIRKQVTVDDGNMALSSLNTYHSDKKDKFDTLLTNRPFIKENKLVSSENEIEIDHTKSDFVADFYSVGDSFLTTDIPLSPASPSGGDFEVVSSKKKGKRSRNGYQNSKSLEYDRFSGSVNFHGSVHSEEGFRGPRFGNVKAGHHYNGSFERPHINFVEVPRTSHESTLIAHWSHLGVGDRYGAERYAVTTTSAPHSEDSGSDGDDSVRSMPNPSITPRPDVRKPPPSSDSTPQTSYANIAKLAASANRAQMKRMATTSAQTGTPTLKELEGEPLLSENMEASDTRLPSVNESGPANILDDNFPSLAESLACVSCPSAMSLVKTNEPRTNQSSENSCSQPGYAGVIENNEQCKETSENESIRVQKEVFDPVTSNIRKATIEKSKSPSELVTNSMQSHTADSKTPDVNQHGIQEPPNHQSVKHQGHSSLHYQKTNNLCSPPPSHQSTQQLTSCPLNISEQNILKMASQESQPLPQKTHSVAFLPLENPHNSVAPQQPQHSLLASSHVNPKQYSQASQSQASQQSQLAYISHSSAGIQHNLAVSSVHPHHIPSHNGSQSLSHMHHQKLGTNQQAVHPHNGPSQEKASLCQQNMSIHLNSHSKLTPHSQKNPQAQEGLPTQSHTHMEHTTPTEHKPSVKLQSDASVFENTGNEERQPSGSRKCQSKQTRNGSAALSVQSSDTSRVKKLEPAVVFTDNAKFSHKVSGIEFGFGFDEPIVTTSDNDDSVSENVEDSNLNCNINNNNSNNNNNNILNSHTVAKDFSKWFKAPKNDKISYNYEELIKHVSKAWEVTLQLMEKDPKNIQYWKAADSREEA